MPSILICCNPVESHLDPTLEVARAFVRRGWRVRVLTAARFADRVRGVGADALPLPPEADHLDPAKDTARGIQAINENIFETFYAPADAQFAAIRNALAAEPTDVVGGDPTFTGIVLVNTLPHRPVVVLASFLPLMTTSRDTAPFGVGRPPAMSPVGRLRNQGLTWLTRHVLLRSVHRKIDAFFIAHGLPPLGRAFFADYFVVNEGLIDLYGQLTVEDFEYPRSDLSPLIRFFGPALPPSQADDPLPHWWHELDGERPVILVTQGTVANIDLGELVMPTVEALADEDVLVVVATGTSEAVPALPRNARVANRLPFDRLMPKVAVFVTNGGYGGLHAALSCGVPIVAAGDTQDKVETTARVAWSGAGINLRTGRPTPQAIRDAVHDVLANPSYREVSARIGTAIAASPGCDGFAAAVEDLAARRAEAVAS